MTLSITTISENALICTLTPPAQLGKQQRLWALADAVQDLADCAEVVIGMNNITVFTPPSADLNQLTHQIQHIWQHVHAHQYAGKHVSIPVQYGGEFGEDLAAVAQFHGISAAEVVKRHTEPVYTVFMMGFQAGFPYLGGLPEHLHTPRRPTPRTQVPAGSVGIGGSQTGVYPFASPAGWQIIGRTELPLFQINQDSPTLLLTGDTVQFVAEKVE